MSKVILREYQKEAVKFTERVKKSLLCMRVGSGIIKLIGETLFFKFVQRALDCMRDVCVCKLRRGLQVSLYVK